MAKIDLKEMFALKQKEMEASFGVGSMAFKHPTLKGDSTESKWLNWFKNFGNKYKAERAVVIDSTGETSEQIDIVLYDPYYSSLIFEDEGQKYIPAESVFAVFEVKPELNATYIKSAQSKIESVRRLKRIPGEIYLYDGSCRKGKEPYEIIGGLLTHRNGWVEGNAEKNLESNLKDTTQLNKINFICCIKTGTFEIEYQIDYGNYKGKNIEILKKIAISKCDKNGVLISAYFKLLKMLARLGNCLAIDYDAYGICE